MTSWKRNSATILIILCCLFARAQQFNYRSTLDSIASSGFYTITITPELSAHLKTDLSDLRVVNNRDQWIPHIIRYPHPEKVTDQQTNLDFSSSRDASSSTVLLIENKGNSLISQFFLRLKNAAAARMTSLSGSIDNKTWFIIADSLLLSSADSYVKDENIKTINFPPTRYKYYKLTIRNGGKDPLNIVGINGTAMPEADGVSEVEENPIPIFNQRDSGKLTVIEVNQRAAYQFDQIVLEVKRPAYYDRLVRVYFSINPGILQTWQSTPIEEFTISSGRNLPYALSLAKAKRFYILILNQDNPPLQITNVKTLQRVRQAVAYLEKGIRYQLLLDNPDAKAPEYDLNHFHTSIPPQSTTLHIGEIVAIPVVSNDARHPSGWWIWLTIAGIILLLAYLSWGLTRDLKKKNEAI